MQKRAWAIVGAVECVVMAAIVAVSFISGGCSTLIECTGGSFPMKCHWAFVACGFVGIAGLVTALSALACTERASRRVAAVSLLAETVIAVLLTTPVGIGLCASPEMHCHLTAHLVWPLCAASAVLALVMFAKTDPGLAEKPKMRL